MVGKSKYVPPPYIPLDQEVEAEPKPEAEAEARLVVRADAVPGQQPVNDGSEQWSSGICACCDDMQSCCVGLFCPCYLFAKNAEILGSGTLMGSCVTHFALWALVNTFCCVLTEGLVFGLPGCFIACYACSYRKTLRTKYNLQETPCGDFFTHFFCHLCAICQEYREIRERSQDSNSSGLDLVVVTAPTVQTMESPPAK